MFGKPLRYPLKVSPLSQKITSNYGYRSFRGGAFHSALDLRAASGTPVIAPAAGRVDRTSTGAGYSCGGNLRLDHSPALQTRYCHLREIYVSPGQEVKAGEVIALSGGDAADPGAGNSQDAHLHFEVAARSPGGEWRLVDPNKYVRFGATGASPLTIGLSLVVGVGGLTFLWWLRGQR